MKPIAADFLVVLTNIIAERNLDENLRTTALANIEVLGRNNPALFRKSEFFKNQTLP